MEYATIDQLNDLIVALKSGEYKQGKSKLETVVGPETTYCCLGVANKICDLGIDPKSLLLHQDGLNGYIFFPKRVQQLLAGLNDTGYPFSSIADTISNIKKAREHNVTWNEIDEKCSAVSNLLF